MVLSTMVWIFLHQLTVKTFLLFVRHPLLRLSLQIILGCLKLLVKANQHKWWLCPCYYFMGSVSFWGAIWLAGVDSLMMLFKSLPFSWDAWSQSDLISSLIVVRISNGKNKEVSDASSDHYQTHAVSTFVGSRRTLHQKQMFRFMAITAG